MMESAVRPWEGKGSGKIDNRHDMIRKVSTWQISALYCLALLTAGGLVGEGASNKEELSEVTTRLFDSESATDEEFQSLLEGARHLGVSLQLLLEAQVSRYWKAGEFDRLVDLLPLFDGLLEGWDLNESQLFRDQFEVRGYYNFFRAVEAKKGEEAEKFEFHVKESYWNSPDLANMLTILIEDRREKERMADLRVPMDLELSTSQGETVTLGELVVDKKGVLLDFWASWCGPCLALIPELVKKAEKLQPQGLVVAGMNTESMATAEKFRTQRKIEFSWLVEPKGNPFQRLLAIDSLPRAIIVNPQGEVLYNGHPMDPTIREVLGGLDLSF